ncbi:MAG TPA: exodeoxyribonuclease VII large subunit [Acidimicrobiales bacterium]|nr:exodeoxyribonuclease VII large subunit [Acidimicrobiales bacterium]
MASGGAPEELRFEFGLDARGEGAVPDEPRPVARAAPTGRRSRRPLDTAAQLRQRIEGLRAQGTARAAVPPEDTAAASDAEAETLSIAAFYERVRRAIDREFAGEVWVAGEIRNLRERGGHRYLELADHDSPGGRASQQLEVVCWARDWPPIAAALAAAGVELEIGRVVRVRGRVSVLDRSSKLSLTLTALDVEALLGSIAAARRRLLATLEAEGLLDANRRRPLPPVPLRVGVVTSPGSEAHRDFVGQLERSGFAFVVRLEGSLVQGPEAPAQLAAALGRLVAFQPDLAVVVRGGGARGDLAAFDDEVVARAIATAPFPVWTGIGHTGDRSVADEVAHRSYITPTACGEAVVAAVREYWDAVRQCVGELSGLARARLEAARHGLDGQARTLRSGARHQLELHLHELVVRGSRVERAAVVELERARQTLASRRRALVDALARRTAAEAQEVGRRRQVLRAYDPRRQLERGWSLTRDEAGRIVRSVVGRRPGERLRVTVSDGSVVTRVEALRSAQEEHRLGAPAGHARG